MMKITIAGTVKSRQLTSLENLVTILPIGFESKNKIFARNTLEQTSLCRFVVLLIVIQNTRKALAIQQTINNNTAPPKIPG